MRRATPMSLRLSLLLGLAAWPMAARGEEEPALAVPALEAPVEAPQISQDPDLPDRYRLVEDFTADTLAPGEVMIGTDLQYGITRSFMIGTDLVATVIGAPTVKAKLTVWQSGAHTVAVGLRGAYLNRETALWGSLKNDFSTLDARVIVPSVAWTRALSPRLKLHTFFAKSFGHIRVALSPQGQRQLWEAEHPGSNYDQRNPTTQAPEGDTASSNQEQASTQRSALMQKSIQVQSVAGLAAERFQLVGEFNRVRGNKVIVTTDIEQTVLEGLKTNFLRLTVAHQWVWTNFQMRIGFGPQYFVASGVDLDGEKLNEAGWTPASDISFYWRF